jgi:hypothetical protein
MTEGTYINDLLWESAIGSSVGGSCEDSGKVEEVPECRVGED